MDTLDYLRVSIISSALAVVLLTFWLAWLIRRLHLLRRRRIAKTIHRYRHPL